MEEKITIELTPLLASVLQRLMFDEIGNQKQWIVEEQREFGKSDHEQTREQIINECEELRTQLESKGFTKYYRYF